MTIRDATRGRIEAAHRFSAIYRGYLANHLPMALVALDALGAGDARIAAYAATYEARLEPIESDAAFRAELADAGRALARDGIDATLRRELPRLLTAPGSGAFHGVIRLAYAVESGVLAELAHALAYWRVALDPLGPVVPFRGTRSPREVLAEVARDAAYAGVMPPGRNIAARMQAARAAAGFDAVAARAGAEAATLDALAEAALHAYAANGSFTLLHAVTACHGLRVLAPWIDDPASALAHAWQSLLAAFIASGAPALDSAAFAQPSDVSWAELRAAAITREDEHDVKLAYTAWREWQRTHDDLYRRVAAARLGALVPEPT